MHYQHIFYRQSAHRLNRLAAARECRLNAACPLRCAVRIVCTAGTNLRYLLLSAGIHDRIGDSGGKGG